MNGTYRNFLYIGCHGGPKLKLMCLGMAGVECWCLNTTGPVHTAPIYSYPKGHEALTRAVYVFIFVFEILNKGAKDQSNYLLVRGPWGANRGAWFARV